MNEECGYDGEEKNYDRLTQCEKTLRTIHRKIILGFLEIRFIAFVLFLEIAAWN